MVATDKTADRGGQRYMDDTGTPLLAFGDGDWKLWNQSMIRSAGFPADGVLSLAEESLAAAADRTTDSYDGFELAWQKRLSVTTDRLTSLARSPLFRLALTWQNPEILATAVDPWLHRIALGGSRNAKQRSRERVLASYWQRYCLKNESIGFFGPTVWAPIGSETTAVVAQPGRHLTDHAVVRLERWPVDVLARQIDAEFDLSPWLAPRRIPLLQLLDGQARSPTGPAFPVGPLEEAILTRSDGTLAARDLACSLAGECSVPVAEVYELLRTLHRRRWLVWKLELPASVHTEDDLRALLDRIDEPARSAALERVDTLISARKRVQAVWDNPDALRVELGRLGESFTKVTGRDSSRNHGKTYGGRTLAYLECRRDLSIRLGQSFVEALEPLSLVLDSVRWLTWRIRQALEPEIRAVYRKLLSRVARKPNAAMLWIECMPLLGRPLERIVEKAVAEFNARWWSVLAPDDSCRRLDYRIDQLREGVRRLFGARLSGWTEARVCSPDVMIAATSVEAIHDGAFMLILGELHVAMNSYDVWSMVSHHPDPGLLFECTERTFPHPRLLKALPIESKPRFTIRAHPALIREQDLRLNVLPHLPLPSSGTSKLASDVLIEEHGNGLCLLVDGTQRFDVFDLFAEVLKHVLVDRFHLFPSDHRPRITVDKLVLARESWTMPLSDLLFADLLGERQRFVATRRWALAAGLPRHVFVKISSEVKPFYVDFASPTYVEALASAARGAARAPDVAAAQVKIVEMMPTPEHVWLPDAAGRRYASECRLTICDGRPSWSPHNEVDEVGHAGDQRSESATNLVQPLFDLWR